jgi:pimeloyl-[acyl-carrier protein] synthase
MHPALVKVLRAGGMQYLLLRERLATGASFNPVSARERENPYPSYRRLREKDPVHKSLLLDGGKILTRYADVSAVMKDARFSANRENATGWGANLAQQGDFATWFSRSMLSLDPPDHTRLRRLVNLAFTPRAVEAMRVRIEQIVEELLDAVQERGRMDIIRDLAYPLPVIVIAEMLGVPAEDRHLFKEWSDALAEALDPLLSDEQLRKADAAVRDLTAYFRVIIKERRRQPREDLLSALAAVPEQHEAHDALSEEEMFATCILLLAAGNETTTNLIGNGMLALLRHPEQLRRLRDDPSLIESAVEELLRYDSPVQMSSRVLLQDVEVGGHTIHKGEVAVVIFGAANRDPEQFPDPDRLDLGRPNNRHLSFGYGVHFCLGASLARVEGQVAINALLRRMPEVRLLTGNVEWRPTVTLRGLKTLPVAFTVAAQADAGAESREPVAAA